MLPLLASSVMLAVGLAALLCRHAARRREKACSVLASEAAAACGLLPGLRTALRSRVVYPPSRLWRFLFFTAISLAAFLITHSLLLASLAWPASILARRLLEGYRRNRARAKKEEQVLEFIDSLSQSLRAGLSLRQSLEVSQEDVGGELGEEVLEILKDIRMGGGLEESLVKAAEDSASPSLRLTFIVLGLLHGKGGDLPRILERLRKRVASGLEVRREARILTSQSRASGYLVSCLPAVFLLLQAALNPHSLRPLLATPMGNLIIAVAVALNAAAFLLIRRMIDLEV